MNDTATTDIYTYGHTLSLHVALPICRRRPAASRTNRPVPAGRRDTARIPPCASQRERRPGYNRGTRQNRIWRRSSPRSEEHTSELQSLMRISYAVFCLKKKIKCNESNYAFRPYQYIDQNIRQTYTS